MILPSSYAWLLIGGAMLSATMGGGIGVKWEARKTAQVKAEYAAYVAQAEANARDAERTAREREREMQDRLDTFVQEAQDAEDRLKRNLANTRAERDRLLLAAKAAASTGGGAACRTPSASDGSSSEQDRDTFDLFIQLLDRHTGELVEVGSYADRLRTAGLICERAYDSARSTAAGE